MKAAVRQALALRRAELRLMLEARRYAEVLENVALARVDELGANARVGGTLASPVAAWVDLEAAALAYAAKAPRSRRRRRRRS